MQLSIVELCTGICICCVPSISKFVRHVFSPVTKPEGESTSGMKRLRSSLPFFTGSTSHSPESHRTTVGGIPGQYQSLPNRQVHVKERDDCELALYPTQSLTTIIVAQHAAGIENEVTARVEEGVIQLKVDLEQHRSTANSGGSAPKNSGYV